MADFQQKKFMIGPSLLASDLSNLAGQSQLVLNCGADFLHLDVMDGHFVPNMTFGAPVIKCLRNNIPQPHIFDVHLMVSNPHQWVDDMADAGATIFTFHVESNPDPTYCTELISRIKSKGMKAGISVKPGTPVEAIFPYLEMVDLVLVMTVEPGFGGQKFMKDMMPKVKQLREMKPELDIEVDGGLDLSTTPIAAEAGANMIVAGSAVFRGDPREAINKLRAAGQQ